MVGWIGKRSLMSWRAWNGYNKPMSECAKWRCDSQTLPRMALCHTHTPRYEIPPHSELECPACGHGEIGTIHDSLYYCRRDECGELLDPRRLPGEERWWK